MPKKIPNNLPPFFLRVVMIRGIFCQILDYSCLILAVIPSRLGGFNDFILFPYGSEHGNTPF